MVLRAIGASASEPTFQHAQLTHVVHVEPFPSVRRTASTLAGDLIAEQPLDAASDTVVMRLDDSASTCFVDELDETLVNDRADERFIHCFTSEQEVSLSGSTSWNRT